MTPLRPRVRRWSFRLASGIGVLMLGLAYVLSWKLPAASAPSALRVRNEQPVTAMNQSIGPANNSPLLAEDPTDARFVALANRLDAPDFSCALQVSGDGGRSWLPVDPVTTLPPNADKCYAPEVAFDRGGRLYYLFVGLHGSGNEPIGAFLTSSTDRARTWTSIRQVIGPANFGIRMAIDPTGGVHGRIHLVWLHATSDPPLGGFASPPNPILTAYSDDGGSTFSAPIEVSDPNRERVVAPALAVGPKGEVHVAYYDLGSDDRDYRGLEGPLWEGTWSLVLSSSFDHGRRFSSGKVVESSIVPPERVMLIFTMAPPSVTVRAERLCTGWTDGRFGDADVFVRCSADRGRTWIDARRVNDDRRGNGLRQFLVRLSFSPEGRLDAIFYDRRRNEQNIGNDVYYASSSDGGRTFRRNARLNSDPSDSRIGQRYAVVSARGQVETGSRLGLLSRSNTVLAAWTDMRNSERGTTGQDIYVATVELPKVQRRWTRSAGLLSGALGVVVLGTGGIVRWRRRWRAADGGGAG